MAAGPWTFQSLKFPDKRSGLGMAHQTPREEGRSPGDVESKMEDTEGTETPGLCLARTVPAMRMQRGWNLAP